MTTVFIGGSRAVSRLNSVIRERIDDLIRRGCTIFIGDANGADKAVQQHLANHDYNNVVVYCVNECRNNVGGWQRKQITVPIGTTGFAYYAAKDLAMAKDAQCGVMLWDGKSKGTLNNIQNLIGAGKKTLVYLASSRSFYKLSSEHDLRALLARCNGEHIQEAHKQIKQKLTPANQLSLHGSHS